MFTRITAAALALVMASATTAGAQTDDSVIIDNGVGDAVVIPLNSSIATVDPGDTEWVIINWTSLNAEARNLKVTAVGPEGVTVSYPTYPVSGYSSGYADSTLSESEMDYTALKLAVDDDVEGPVSLTITVTYDSDTGSHANQHEMPMGDGDDDDDNDDDDNDNDDNNNVDISNPALPLCDLMDINSFVQKPKTFTFQARNTTSGPLNYEFVIPNANYELDSFQLNSSTRNAQLSQVANGDGTYTITISGHVLAHRSIGGHQPKGFGGQLNPTSGEPFIRCASA